ncbi:Pleckstrin -like proteiny domain-containing family G member 6 [Collichthys lucidus]|uniref:Pleckstrin-like proteiny domain-containing family G member 6 n=1 Tax=Collichthys lucidus TaxID=240159 RepID=A0A4V6AQX4_COLLU|nr:Pleckstrin -like proteiny domain-containing family G member 6 [Collichthys lucidus]
MERGVHRGRWNKSALVGIILLLMCKHVSTLQPSEVETCREEEYPNSRGICCNKCFAGPPVKSVPMENTQDQMNFSKNCRKCRTCKASKNEEMESPCEKKKNTICRCKAGYYKSVIDSETYECRKCTQCRLDEKEKQKYPNDGNKHLINIICGTGAVALVLLVLVIVITYVLTKWVTKKRLLQTSSQPSDDSPDSSQSFELLIPQVEPSNTIIVEAVPINHPSEQEQLSNLPDCVPLEIKIPDLIYTVLDLVPVLRMKQLVRSLGVTDSEIEQAELDYRPCREAHYQMLKIWTERGSRAGGMLHRPLLQELLNELRKMHLGRAAEELETKIQLFPSGQLQRAGVQVKGREREGPIQAERKRRRKLIETKDDWVKQNGSNQAQRRTKQKVVTDFATVVKGTSAGTKPRTALRQVLFSQGVSEKNQPSEERGQLDVLKQDLGTYAVPVSLKWRWKEESRGTTLEKNWTDIVESHSLVIAALVNLHQHGFLLEVTPELLFSNLPSILNAHQLFWQEVIYPMLEEVRRTGMPFDPKRLEAGCLQFHQRFSCYKHYCWEEENNLEFTRRQMEGSPHFFTYIQWVETHPQCDRMRLGDMQAKPHQRITKYPLLLKAVLKTTEDPHVQHTLKGMLSSVNNFLESINDYLKLKDEELALTISAQRVEGYEVEGINEEIDKHVREICQFDLTCPIRGVGPEVVRRLLLEENLKIRVRKDSKLEVVALLFSDVLLMTKVQKKGERLKVVRPPLALDKTFCIALKDGCSFVLVEVGELQSAMNVYIFTSSTSESCSTWVSTIHQAKPNVSNRKVVRKSFAGQPQPAKGYEWIEMGVRRQQVEFQREEGEKMVESLMAKERRVNWNSRVQSAPNLDHLTHGIAVDQFKYNTTAPHALLLGGYPDIDYPMNEEISSQPSYQPTIFNEFLPAEEGISTKRDSDLQSVNQNARRNSSYTQSGNIETFPEGWGFSKNLTSPRLRRRRPNSTHQASSSSQASRQSQDSGVARSDSYSNSDSEQHLNFKRNSVPSEKNSESHRVLKLGALKPNQGMFWNIHDRVSPDSQTLSEPELPDINLYNKRPKMKTQRSASIPNIIIEGGHGLRLHSSSLYTLPQANNTQFPTSGHNPNGHPSPLDGLLVRARDRVRDRDLLKRDRNLKMPNLKPRYHPPSPSFSTTPSPSPSDGDRDREWDEEVELMRHRALTVSGGWKEQLVDGDEDERRDSVVLTDGVNVDWSGWCFDDDEVMDYLQPGGEGLLEDISRSLASWNLHRDLEQEDGECSQV